MKITVGWKKTEAGYGRPAYCVDAPFASVELDCPDGEAKETRQRIVNLFAAVRAEVERQCVESRPAAREPGDDDEDDVQPGDPAYDRQHPQMHPKHGQQPAKNWQNGYQGGAIPSGRPSGQQQNSGGRPSGQGGQKDYGPPRNPKELLGWLNKQPDDIKARAYGIISDWELDAHIMNWNHEGRNKDARGLWDKLQTAATNGNGYHH